MQKSIKHKNMTHQLRERDPELEMIKLADENFKIAIIVSINIFKIRRKTWMQ